MRGDGHCIIHAAILCLQHAWYDIIHVDLCSALVSEVITNLAYYDNFSTDDKDVVKGICRLIFNKEYNTDTCDLLVSALSNATGSTITIYQYREETKKYAPIVLKPGRLGVPSKYTINMVRRGEGFGAHYSALLSNQQEPSLDEPTLDPTFSPEVVKSHPRAPPRAENTRGRRKRKFTVLTDTPEKNALRDEQRHRESRKGAKSTNRATTRKPRLVNGKKSLRYKSRKNVIEDEEVCIVCLSPWLSSKSGEQWVQCISCSGWAHVECAGAENSGSNAHHAVDGLMWNALERRTVGPMHIMQCMGSCGMRWSGEQWVQCTSCSAWAHVECAGAENSGSNAHQAVDGLMWNALERRTVGPMHIKQWMGSCGMRWSGEQWVQCTSSSGWAHVECAGVENSPTYSCHGCS